MWMRRAPPGFSSSCCQIRRDTGAARALERGRAEAVQAAILANTGVAPERIS